MSRYFLAAALVVGLAVPAMAAKAKPDYDRCKIVNIAPYYTKTIIRKGRRVFLTRETSRRDMAIICP